MLGGFVKNIGILKMRVLELFTANQKSAGVFACGECKIVHKTQAAAEQCCDWKCHKCGAKTDRFSTQCSACWDIVRAEGHARRLAAAKLVTEYDGWICCESGCGSNDGYFQSIEDYVDYIYDEGWGDPESDECREWPEFVFACEKEVKGIDVGHVIENLCEDGYEDMGENFTGMDELRAAVDAWNAKNQNGLTCWSVDYKKKIAVPPRPVE